MKNWKLKWQFTVPIVLSLMIGIFSLSAVSIHLASSNLEAQIHKEMEQVTNQLTAKIEDWQQTLHRNTQVYGRTIEAIAASDSTGKKVEEYMQIIKKHNPSYELVAITDGKGKVQQNTVGKKLFGLDLSKRSYFKKSISGSPFLSEAIISKNSGNPVVVQSVPINAGDGKVFLVAVDLGEFNKKHIDPIRIGTKGGSTMMDATGAVIAHQVKELLVKTNIQDFDFGAKIYKQKNGFLEYHFNNADRLANFRTIEGSDWIVSVNAEKADLYGVIGKMEAINAMLGVGILLFIVALVFYFVGGITKRIEALLGSVKLISKGDLEARVQIQGSDEVSQLGVELNNMADVLTEKAELAKAISEGDLTSTSTVLSEKDVLGKSNQQMLIKLNQLISQIKISSNEIDSGTTQLNDASIQLSSGATQSAASIEEIGASITEVTSQISGNVKSAEETASISKALTDQAEDGKVKMNSLKGSMDEINASTTEISKIIKTIDDIAFQTNLLALNAAVEAARAGQHGKGFAVVAEEVRNLAARSAKASQETADLIEGSVDKIQQASKLSNVAEESLINIVGGISSVSELNEEIVQSSIGTASAMEQIKNALDQVDSVTQGNSATAEETASAAELLTQQVGSLKSQIVQFKVRELHSPKPINPTEVSTSTPVLHSVSREIILS